MTNYNSLLQKVQTISTTSKSLKDKLEAICQLLQQEVPHYNWVGFYFANHPQKMLYLGPFAGDPTDHTQIPFGKGICGQVAESNQNFVVPDVNAQDNYLSCSITVKAEIVVPLFVNGNNIGQIDIDSHHLDPFTRADEEFLEQVNQVVGKLFEQDLEELEAFIN